MQEQIGNPSLSRGISVCFSVGVAWRTVVEAVWSSLDENVCEKIGIFRLFSEIPKIFPKLTPKPAKFIKSDIKSIVAAFLRYRELESSIGKQFGTVFVEISR